MMLPALAGCSSPSFYWYHPDRTLDEAKADYLECQDQACQKADDVITERHYDRLPPPDDAAIVINSPAERARSADPGQTQDAWRARYEQSVVADGMRAKGYLRLRADHVPPGVHTQNLSPGGVAGR